MLQEISNELLMSIYKKAINLSKDANLIKILKDEMQKRNLLSIKNEACK